MKETGVEIDMVCRDERFLNIILRNNDLSQIPVAMEMLNGELPAEISFFVPEFHHKRIIGHGGKNIQRIMKKYGVYIKFLNLDECISQNGHPSITALGNVTKFLPNVIVKTPNKNRAVLYDVKGEVLMEANENEIFLSAQLVQLPMGEESFFGGKTCEGIRRTLRECGIDYFMDEEGKNLLLVGLKEGIISAQQRLSQVLPVECVSLSPLNANGVSFRYLERSKCYFASQVDLDLFKENLPEDLKILSSSCKSNPDGKDDSNSGEGSAINSANTKFGFKDCFDSFFFSDTLKTISEVTDSIYQKNSNFTESSTFKIPPPGLIGCQKKSNSTFDYDSVLWSSFLSSKLSNNSLSSNIIPIRNINSDSPTLESILESLELTKYLELFKKHEIDFKALCTLSDDDLKEIGIYALGSRKKLLNALQSLRSSPSTNESLQSSDSFLQPRGLLNGSLFSSQDKKNDFNLFMSNCNGPSDIPYKNIFNCNDFSHSVLY